MEIAIIAHDMTKELMAQFCIAYCGILSKHNICATAVTAKYISEATGLSISKLMAGEQGGEQQVASRWQKTEIMYSAVFFCVFVYKRHRIART